MTYEVDINEFPKILREFASQKSAIEGCSEKTVGEYLLDLRTFFRYLLADDAGISPESDEFLKIDISQISIEYITSVTKEQIYEFLLYTGTVRKNMWSAKARKLSAIKGFYKFLVTKRGLLSENPAADIEAPKRQKTLPKFLSLDESKLLLDAILSDTKSPHRLRDFCMITLFLNCGMRVSELAGINTTDIDRDMTSLRVIGKGHKERIIYLNEACQYAISVYLEERNLINTMQKDGKALFLSNRDQRISVKTIQHVVYKYLDLAGLGAKHYSVHKLRHTAATLMYQSGQVDIRVLKDILGHAQLNTTEIYTHVSNENMQRAMDSNPLAALKPDVTGDDDKK